MPDPDEPDEPTGDLAAPPAGRLRTARVMLGLAWAADPRRSVLAFGLFTLQALVAALFGWWLKLLLDGITAHDVARTVLAALALTGSVVGGAALDYAGTRVRMALNERAHHLVERRLALTVARTPTLEIHETPAHLTQLEILVDDSWEFGEAIPSLVNAANAAVRVVTTAILLVSVHPLLLALPLFGLPMLLLSRHTSGLFNLGNELAAEPARRANDLWELATASGSAKETRLFRLGDRILAGFHAEHRKVQAIHRRLQVRGQLIGLGAQLAFLVGYFGSIVFVVDQAVRAHNSVGDVLLTAVLAGQVLGLVGNSAEIVQWTARTLTAASRFVYLEDIAHRARRSVDATVPLPSRLTSGIHLRGLSYRYPHRDTDVLHDLDLHLPAGSTVAVVGDNGAGKTTLVKLLAGLYVPTAGRIEVDGADLATLDPERWRLRVSAAFQDHARWEFSVRETVGIGDLTAVDDGAAVAAALDRAGAGDLPATLPAGPATQLGAQWPGGVDLSGGQWQKLAVGRGMMRQAPLLLLLDEPTAALDAETEHRLYERWTVAARELRRSTGAVTVLVSHRFSTVRMADLIVVLDRGRIVESGTHAELVARRGLYAELFELQAASYR
ncbi:ATP-binding cassette, subfamily B [Actinopolymorpha cephalotaxi]|uniref:ATP-binding cassette subfamily B protein n=1 Tax=Actinopolymorpha cephalotaxi TaxID=504797 RepID=A0A1I2KC98_9ACTN|nr:ABC transporter ATP-binding protein [Actinopolymorpha cephalotaxi]NYH84393.1 ATP-binding cassette subfamily B protein [Actinopolymorpha cephalotaxi]SFF63978.1 ATP-binding cassette, subfamily B [Actinopolymorpha cephalotaxi]